MADRNGFAGYGKGRGVTYVYFPAAVPGEKGIRLASSFCEGRIFLKGPAPGELERFLERSVFEKALSGSNGRIRNEATAGGMELEFITGICPSCQGELQIPKGHEKIICMYCGKEIDTKTAAGRERQTSPEERRRAEEAAKTAAEQFPMLLFSIKDPLKDFKKSMYEGSFRAYEKAQEDALNAIEDAYLLAEEKEEFLTELVSDLLTQVQQRLDGKKGKRGQEDAMMNFNMCLVVYVNPALLDCNKSSGRPLVEELLRQWKERFPKTNLKPADFETINGGFKRRFCYITTAVCESLGKPDDCYELNLLREYRDGYLLKQPDGEALIHRYYDIAPTIVKRIHREGDAHRVYEGIWREFLSPCIRLIEAEDNEGCREIYQDMVYTLDKRYFHREEEMA